jgi:hypothetical protein
MGRDMTEAVDEFVYLGTRVSKHRHELKEEDRTGQQSILLPAPDCEV